MGDTMRAFCRLRFMTPFLSNTVILVSVLLMLLFALPAHAKDSNSAFSNGQTYYLVFELDQNDEPRLVHQQRVQLAATPASDPMESVWKATSSTLPERGPIIARVVASNGEQIFQKVINLNQDIRAEFAGPDGSQIERHEVHSGTRSFVLRIPAFTNGTLKLENQSVAEFSIARIAAETAIVKPQGERTESVVVRTGKSSNRVDLLIIGDGYTNSESGLFDADVLKFNNKFFAISPYLEYQSFVNFTGLFVPSIESGADHPQFDTACAKLDLRCCADPTASSDPRVGTMVDTAFDAAFCRSNIHRFIGVDELKVYIAAAAYPDWDEIFVLVNDPVYGGAGGAFSIASTHPEGIAIIQHEYGHTFSGLADEYDTPFPTYPACSDLPEDPGLQTCQANVTNETNRAEIKWNPWIEGATPIPTPEDSGYLVEVGLFEGGRYLTNDMYRPREYCAMRSLGSDFCEICQQEYILRLYLGGWGAPHTGIDLIEPGSESPNPGAFSSSDPVRLSVDVVQPLGGVSIEWKVGGIVQPGENSSSFIFYPDTDGVYLVEVEVSDPTTKVHAEMKPVGAMSSKRNWTVTADVDAAIPINAGMNDAWVSEEAPFQGFFFTVFPDAELFFLSWFTFDSEIPAGADTAVFGAFDQRWVTGSGQYSGNRVAIKVESTSGGKFNSTDPLASQKVSDGGVTVVFTSCTEAVLFYDFPSIGHTGQQTLNRILPDNAALCTTLAAPEMTLDDVSNRKRDKTVTTAFLPAPRINPGMNDAWVSEDAPFQGLFFTVFPDAEIFFVSWFTFDSETPAGDDTATFGAFDQRWVTGSGHYTGNQVTAAMESTSGGIFGGSDPIATQGTGYGTVTVEFTSCTQALLSYEFPAAGLYGDMTLSRVLPDNVALCQVLATP